MWYLKDIRLQNFMGYRDTTFSFLDDSGYIKPICLIFSPNGCGKTSLLNAINIVYSSPRLIGRGDSSLLFRKMVFNEDYDPTYQSLKVAGGLVVEHDMLVTANLFNPMTGEDGVVEFNNQGIIKTCLSSAGYGYYIDADNAVHLSKFQIVKDSYSEKFLDLAKLIYNFNCYFDDRKSAADELMGERLNFYTDFIIEKFGVKVHYKSFSGGERKIATMLAQICDKSYIEKASVIVIDSFEKEIYFKRQSRVVDRLIEFFPGKQFFIVTHSETLIRHVGDRYGDSCLYDIEKYRMADLNIDAYTN